MLVVVRLGRGEERLGVERLVAEELEPAAAEPVGPRLDDVVRRALAVVHHGRAARLDLELIDGFDRDPEREVAAFALHHGVGDRHAFDVGVVREILSAHDVAPAPDRLHAGHQEHERRRIARTAGVHHQRQRRVDLVADRLPEAGVGRAEQWRRRRDGDLLCHAAHLQRDVEADDAERVDDHLLLDEGLEPVERHLDAVHARRAAATPHTRRRRWSSRRRDAGRELVAVTVAPGRAAPEGSRTVP